MCELQYIIYSQGLVVRDTQVIFLRDYGRQNNTHPSPPKDICLLIPKMCDWQRGIRLYVELSIANQLTLKSVDYLGRSCIVTKTLESGRGRQKRMSE